MKKESAILEVLFPKVRAEILRLLFIAPIKQRYVRELATLSGLALCTIQDELRKLSAVNLVTSWSNGYHRFYQANRDHPLFPELERLVQLSARLPQTKQKMLDRPGNTGKQRRHRPGRASRLRANRPTNWRLFSRT
jgi:predicted transcriptional regulator